MQNKENKTEIKNVSGIDFENNASDQTFVRHLRYGSDTPTNFKQKILTDFYGPLIDNAKNVLEIGCGWGRNALYFKDIEHINYFAFDTSPTSLQHFKNLNLGSRFYISPTIDQTILSQKYDLIFSTFVLQHIGIFEKEMLDSIAIANLLMPQLNSGAYWVSYELHQGQNNWNPSVWSDTVFKTNNINLLYCQESPLEGSDQHSIHTLIIGKKI